MEGLAFRKDRREMCTRSADEFRAEPLDPSKSGFDCKNSAISFLPQPSKGGIFIFLKAFIGFPLDNQ